MLICLTHSFDALKTDLQIRGAGASRSELTAHLAQLFLIHECAAGRHDIVFGFEFDDGTFGGRGLFTQRLKPLLQPVARASICLVLGVQLIEYIGIDHRIGDFDGLLPDYANENQFSSCNL